MGNLAEMAAGAARSDADELELTIVLPCLNEAETVAVCVSKAVRWIRDAGVAGEVSSPTTAAPTTRRSSPGRPARVSSPCAARATATR